MAKKKSSKQLWLMLALIVVVTALILLLPMGGKDAKTTSADPETEKTTIVKAGDTAPGFSVEMFDGTTVSLADLRGKVVLLNFWATWCAPCREELTRVQSEIIDRFAGREFVFLPVSRGEDREKIKNFRETTGHTFPMGLDPDQKIYALYASNFIPRNFLIGADGKVVLATVGYEQKDFDSLVRMIETTLDATTNSKIE